MMFPTKEQVTTSLIQSSVLMSTFMMIGAVNLSQIWALMQEIIDNTSVIVGLVIMGVTISIAVYIGVFIKKLLSNAVGKV